MEMDNRLKTLLDSYEQEKQELLGEMKECGYKIQVAGIPAEERSGVLPSGATFSLHGRGVRFEKSDGTVIEVDKGPDGRMDGVDPWRLFTFSSSSGQESYTEEQLKDALEGAKDQGDLVTVEDPLYAEVFFPSKK